MKNATRQILLGTILATIAVVSQASGAFARVVLPGNLQVKATLTADNHYALFSGNETGSILNFYGRNEKGAFGGGAGWNNGNMGGQSFNPGNGYNWSSAETWNFNMSQNDYMYVVTWDDSAVDESWVGQFDITAGDKTKQLLSTPGSWEYMTTQWASNPGDWADTPTDAVLNKEISAANWFDAKSRGLNNGQTGPWGRIGEVTDKADFLNTTTNVNGNKRDNDRFTIFRTKVNIGQTVGLPPVQSVPEPTTLIGLAGVGLASLAARKRKKS
jgi:PEP-CTERM motif